MLIGFTTPDSNHPYYSHSRGRAPALFAPAVCGLICVLFGCTGVRAMDGFGAGSHSSVTREAWPDAAAGVANPALASIVGEAWESWLHAHPFEAGKLGDARYLGAIPVVNDSQSQSRIEELRELSTNLGKIDRRSLNASDQLTRDLLLEDLDNERKILGLNLRFWQVDPVFGPHVKVLDLTKTQPIATQRERAQLVERWLHIDTYMRRAGDNLRHGAKRGLVANRTAIVKSIQQLEGILNTPPMDSPLVKIATGGGRWVDLPAFGSVSLIAHDEFGDAREQSMLRRVNLHLQEGARLASGTRVLIPSPADQLTPKERGKFLYAVLKAVEERIYPSFAAYRSVLVNDILPIARDDTKPGISALEGGAEAYIALIHKTTSLPLDECDPSAIRAYGLQEVARIRAEIADLGEKLFGTRVISEIQTRMRHDPAMFFEGRSEIEAKASSALARAQQAVPSYFARLPRTACEVARIPSYEEMDSTSAYYDAPDASGQRPGIYFVNTFQPRTRPRFEAEVLAFHESVPGHHLQIALQQELEHIPRFRRHGEREAFVEGWALYAEHLADEMGLYSSDLDRMGMLSFDAWRAARLVVDTGLHAFGWTREHAIDYMFDNTLLSRENVVNEVDRYIAWPSQALAYKIGEREIEDLRARARQRLGSEFSLARFHAAILDSGALSLEALRSVVGNWLDLEAQNSKPATIQTPEAGFHAAKQEESGGMR